MVDSLDCAYGNFLFLAVLLPDSFFNIPADILIFWFPFRLNLEMFPDFCVVLPDFGVILMRFLKVILRSALVVFALAEVWR